MRSAESRIRNLQWLAAGNLLVKPLWFFFLLYSTRALGPEEFGRFMLALSALGIVWYVFEGGIDLYTMRELSLEPERIKQLFSLTTSLKLLLGVCMIAALCVSAMFGAVPGDARVLFGLAAVFTIVNALMVHVRYVFRAFEVMRYEAASIILEKGAVVVLCLASLWIAARAEIFMAAYVLAYIFAATITVAIVVRSAVHLQWTLAPARMWREVLKPALPFALMGIFTVVYYRSGTIMLQWLTGDEQQVGYFNAGYRLVESFALLPSIIVLPLYPSFARNVDNRREVFRLAERGLRAVLVVSLVLAVPLMLFREEFTLLLFGEAYRPASQSLGVIVLTMIPVGMGWLFTYLAGAVNRQRRMNVYIVLITVLNVFLNLVLINRFAVLGASVTTLVTESAITLAALWVVRDYLERHDVLKVLLGGALASVIVIAAKWLRLLPGPFIVQVCLAVAVLIGTLWAVGLLRIHEVRTLLGRK